MNQLMKNNHQTAKVAPQLDYVLVDSSGSMFTKWSESIAAVDAFMAAIKPLDSEVILHMFYSQNVDYIHRQCKASQWIPLIENCPAPQGGTPLFDAIRYMGLRLRELMPQRCSVLIVTDGEEGGSTHTTLDQAKAILDWMRAMGWQVTFFGCDFSNYSQAKMLGSSVAESIGVQKALLSDAAKSLGEKRINYGRNGAPMHFSKDEQQQFGGYLAPPR